MHLASDYIYSYRSAGGRAFCRVRIYLPQDVRDAPVVICSELPNNTGGSVTSSAEVIAAEVIRSHELPTPLVWIACVCTTASVAGCPKSASGQYENDTLAFLEERFAGSSDRMSQSMSSRTKEMR